MTIIFKAKAADGYPLKILLELLQNNFKTACFRINKGGIFLRMHDPNYRTLMDLVLEADKFTFFIFKGDRDLFMGTTLTHFHKMIKPVKKKDAVVFLIDNKQTDRLNIKIIPKDNQSRVSESGIKIQNTQNIEIDLPNGYSRAVNLSSADFQKACREVAIGNDIKVTSRGFQIKFYCAGGGICDKSITFGEAADSDSDSDADSEAEAEDEYEQNFEMEQLSRITKIAGLSSDMQIFPKAGRPLLFKSQVGILGRLAIYIKSKELMQEKDGSDGE